MKRYLIMCGVSLLVGLALGSQLIDNFPHIRLSEEAAAAPGGNASSASAYLESLDDPDMTPEEQVNVAVYDAANRSVVNISTRSVAYDRFFGIESEAEGSGSGSIVDQGGHILTNYHVVDGAQEIEVTLADGNSYDAKIIGHDLIDDMAVLQIDAPREKLVPIRFGDSANLRVGRRVYALGNPFGWERTMTTGIISGLNRTLPSRQRHRSMKALIQTDTAMNPGNSGGPLLDTAGRMIGMNVAIARADARQNSGVGFAIPVNRIKRQVQELIEYGKVTRADLGITAVMPTDKGVMVGRVTPDGPAERAGIRPIRIVLREQRRGPYVYQTKSYDVNSADIITAIDGEPVDSTSEFVGAIEARRPGDEVTLSILRGGRVIQVPVTLGAS